MKITNKTEQTIIVNVPADTDNAVYIHLDPWRAEIQRHAHNEISVSVRPGQSVYLPPYQAKAKNSTREDKA